MPSLQEKLRGLLRRVPVASLVLAVGVAFSVVAWRFTETQIELAARSKFDTRIVDARGDLQARLRGYYDLMHALQGLFVVTPFVTRDAFERYIVQLDLEHRGGIRAISYSARVPGAAKLEFVQRVRRGTRADPRGIPGFEIRPPGERPEYVPVLYSERGNLATLGFDLVADPVRRASIERARDTGSITASERVRLFTVPVEGEWGASLRLAVYRPGMPVDTTEQRRSAFAGIISVTFLTREMTSDTLWQHPAQPLFLRIVDGGARNVGTEDAEESTLLLDSTVLREARPYFMERVPIEVGGRIWQFEFSAPKHYFLTTTDTWLPWLVLLAGLLISILLGRLVRMLATEGQHAEAQRLAQELIEALPNPIYFKGVDGRYRGVNKAWEKFFGIPRASFISKTVHDLYPHDRSTADRLHADDQLLWQRRGTQTYETAITTNDGARHDAVYYKAAYTDARGGVAGLIATIIDITDRKRAEQRQAMEHAVTRLLAASGTLAEAVPTIIQTICETLGWHCGSRWALDPQAGLLRCHECWGIDSPEIQEFVAENAKHTMRPEVGGDQALVRGAFNSGKPVWIADLARATGFKRAALIARANLRGAFCFPLLDGEDVLGVLEFFHRDVREPDETLIYIAQSIGRQIGQYMVRKQAEEKLLFVATHDTLTRLPNRAMFQDRLEHATARTKRSSSRLALLFIDLDGFKHINDTLGHDAGDVLLCEVARRLTETLRASDTVGRLGGDEFVVLMEDVVDRAQAGNVAQKLVAALGASFQLAGQAHYVTGSVGVSLYPDDADDIQALFKSADAAMYRAKKQGKNMFQFYAPQTSDR